VSTDVNTSTNANVNAFLSANTIVSSSNDTIAQISIDSAHPSLSIVNNVWGNIYKLSPTTLFHYVWSNNLTKVKHFILKLGIHINSTDPERNTLLCTAGNYYFLESFRKKEKK
jgi:hypothetical protein